MPENERLKQGGSRTKGLFAKESYSGKPLVSIITVCLNSEKYLEQAIRSVINQTYDNIEYIIIDGGSTDRTLDVIRKYEDKITCWISEPDEGLYDAMNKGMKLMNGDIWACLNSDDQYYPDALTKVAAYFSDNPSVDVIFGNIDFVGENGEFIYRRLFPKFDLKRIMRMNYCGAIQQPATFIRKSVITNVGYFDTSYDYAADQDYFVRVGKSCKIKHINAILTRFRRHSDALSTRGITKQLEEGRNISRKYSGNNYNRFMELWDRMYLNLFNLRMINFQYIVRYIANGCKRRI